MEAQQAILANLKLDFIIALTLAVTVFLVMLWSVRRLTLWAMVSRHRRWVTAFAVVLVGSCLTYGYSQDDQQRSPRGLV